MGKKHALKVVFSKEGDMIYFSQLDVFRLCMRALRRCGFELFYTSGYNPHPKMSFYNALKLGKSGELGVTFYFSEEVSVDTFKEEFSKQIPNGLKILSAEPFKK